MTIVSSAETSSEDQIKKAFLIVEPDQRQLAAVSDLLNAWQLRAIVDTVVPFFRGPEAYAGSIQRQGRGKIVLRVDNNHERT